MELLNVLAAAAGAFAFGGIWYTTMAKPWMEAAGLTMGPDGRPAGGGSPMPFVVGIAAMILVAGMMRHVFAMAGLDTIGEGIMGGVGIGTFFIMPWVAMNYAFGQRGTRLTLIDSVNAIVGCTIMGIILTLF